jgi:hypothetical protein
MEIIKKILEESTNKFEQPLAKSLDKKFDVSKSRCLEDITRLAYIKYASGEVDTALTLVDLFTDIEFDGNHDIWTWVEYGLVLKSAILKERGELERAAACTQRKWDSLEASRDPALSKKIFKRTLNGKGVSYKEIERAANDADTKSEYSWRLSLLMRLMLIREMGGGEDFIPERANTEMQENIAKMRELHAKSAAKPKSKGKAKPKINADKIQDVLAENLGEGYRIVRDNGELSPKIDWVDWVQQSDDADDITVEVNFDDDSEESFEKGTKLRQIWHEDTV